MHPPIILGSLGATLAPIGQPQRKQNTTKALIRVIVQRVQIALSSYLSVHVSSWSKGLPLMVNMQILQVEHSALSSLASNCIPPKLGSAASFKQARKMIPQFPISVVAETYASSITACWMIVRLSVCCARRLSEQGYWRTHPSWAPTKLHISYTYHMHSASGSTAVAIVPGSSTKYAPESKAIRSDARTYIIR